MSINFELGARVISMSDLIFFLTGCYYLVWDLGDGELKTYDSLSFILGDVEIESFLS